MGFVREGFNYMVILHKNIKKCKNLHFLMGLKINKNCLLFWWDKMRVLPPIFLYAKIQYKKF